MELPSRILGRTGFPVSVIGLGTAEIGFLYGIGKKTLPSDVEAEAFLRSAAELGVTYFDTAHAYQLSEERIGRSKILKNPRVLVGTKCAQFLEKGEKLSAAEIETQIRAEVEESRRKLQIDQLPLLYLHGPTVEHIKEGIVINILSMLQSEGRIKWVGASVRGEEAALAAIQSGFFDVIQVAHSILDQRMNSYVLPAAQMANIGVVNRSVFLKGALTSRRVDLPTELALLLQNADRAEAIAQSVHIGLPALAIQFALSRPEISTVLIGTNKIEHLRSGAEAARTHPLSGDILERLQALAINDPTLVDPAKWPPLS